MQEEDQWDIVIKPKSGLFQVDLKGIWHYRDLIWLFVRRDFVAQYKQTILGPVWMLIQPLLSTILFSLIFANIAGISTAGMPPVLFYLSAFVAWTYFSECMQKTSSTFTSNASIFGKVYFPRLVTPVSQIISNMFRFLIQLLMFALIYVFYVMFKGLDAAPNYHIIFLPILVLLLGGMGLGIGLLISSLTTRFRDLNFLIGFSLQLLMYGSGVIISLHTFPKWENILRWNPMVWLIEGFRYALLGVGEWSWAGIGYSAICVIILLSLAALTFGKVEKNFMDTV